MIGHSSPLRTQRDGVLIAWRPRPHINDIFVSILFVLFSLIVFLIVTDFVTIFFIFTVFNYVAIVNIRHYFVSQFSDHFACCNRFDNEGNSGFYAGGPGVQML